MKNENLASASYSSRICEYRVSLIGILNLELFNTQSLSHESFKISGAICFPFHAFQEMSLTQKDYMCGLAVSQTNTVWVPMRNLYRNICPS